MSSLTKTLLVATLLGASYILHLGKLKSIENEVLKVDQLASNADLNGSLDQADATALKPLVNRVFANSTTKRGKLKNLITQVLVMNEKKESISSATELRASVEGIRETLSMVLEGGVTDQTAFDFDPNRLWSDWLKCSWNWSDGTVPGQHQCSRDFDFQSARKLRTSIEEAQGSLTMNLDDQLLRNMAPEAWATDQSNSSSGQTKLWSELPKCSRDWSNGTLPGQHRCSRDFGCHSTPRPRASVEGTRDTLSMYFGDQLMYNMVLKGGAIDQTTSDPGLTKLLSDSFECSRDRSDGTLLGQHRCSRDFGYHRTLPHPYAGFRHTATGLNHGRPPKWTSHFKEVQNQKGERQLESYKGSDICSFCANQRRDRSLHLPGAENCLQLDHETNASAMTKRHKRGKARQKGKPKAQDAKVTPKEEKDTNSVDIQY